MTGLVLGVAAAISFRTLQAAGRRGRYLAPGPAASMSEDHGRPCGCGGLSWLLASAVMRFLRSVRSLLHASTESRRLGPTPRRLDRGR